MRQQQRPARHLLVWALLATFLVQSKADEEHGAAKPAAAAASSHGSHWSYEGDSGPEHWDSIAPTCGGSQQSPINIDPAAAKPENFQPLFFGNYDVTPKVTKFKNNGHTVVLSMETDRMPYVSDGGLQNKYIFAQMHVHWGKDSSRGSEHVMKSVKFPGEIHLVHFNEKYQTFGNATGHPDGLAVVGVLIKTTGSDSATFRPIVEVMEKIEEPDKETSLATPFALKDILPSSTAKFFRYQGSLTTPGCNEIVTWTVLDAPLLVSEKQISKFRSLKSEDGPLVDNYRPPQPLNGRSVYVRSGSSTLTASLAALLLPLVMQAFSRRQ